MKRERYNLSVAVFVLLRKAQRICMLIAAGQPYSEYGW